jgi:cyclase
MLKKRLIPKMCVTLNQNNEFISVLTKGYLKSRAIGLPISQAMLFQSNKADEIIIVNVDKNVESINRFPDLIDRISPHLNTPLTVGGSIDSFESIDLLLSAGADKLILNGSKVSREFIVNCANRYGSQSLIGSVDATSLNSLSSHKGLIEIVDSLEESGIGEICFNDATRDGTRTGLNLELFKKLSGHTSLPFILGCGVGKAEHIIDGFIMGADAVTSATYFAKFDQNPLQLRSRIATAGVDIRF